MRWMLAVLVHLAVMGSAAAQDAVHFPSFDAGEGRPATELTGYLFRLGGTGPLPAAVFLHGCGRLISSHARSMGRQAQCPGRRRADDRQSHAARLG